jgi:hypothetical protein
MMPESSAEVQSASQRVVETKKFLRIGVEFYCFIMIFYGGDILSMTVLS